MRHVLWTNAAPAGALAALAVCWAGCGAILGVDADATLASTGAGGHSSTTTGSGGQSTATGQGGAGGQGGTTTTSKVVPTVVSIAE